jgi:hypothetical protein
VQPPTLNDLIAKYGRKQALWLWDPRKQRELDRWRKRKMAEELIASAGSSMNIPVHPAEQFPATCIDIVDLGMVELTWQGTTRKKHRFYLRFFCGEYFEDDEGKKRPLWIDQYFTLSLHENSALRPFLENWRGKKFTEDELRGFDLMNLLHAPAFLQVDHTHKNGKTYADIVSVMRLPKAMEAPGVPNGYVRVKDRPPREDGPQPDSEDGFGPIPSEPDSSLPF